jgi:hypothetical protein
LSIGQLPFLDRELPMGDLLFLALGLGAFGLFAAYAAVCARV